MANPIRLFHSDAQQYFLVHDGCVYADIDGDGRIGKHERYTGAAERALLAAARHFADYYVAPFPGARSLDPQITSAGRLNHKEASTFAHEPKGVAAKRPDLFGHLDFFDRLDGDGMISLRENYRGWRDLGYGVLKSVSLALGAAAVFGRLADRFGIDVERIVEKRPQGSSRIYGPDGNVDQSRLAELAAVFDERGAGGTLTHDQMRAAFAEKTPLGTIPKRQFESLLVLTERINGEKTVTKKQFLGLFDNSLFWAVASMTDNGGRRTL